MTSKHRRRVPKLSHHKATGKGRVILNGQHFYTESPFGTVECHSEYQDLLLAWRGRGYLPIQQAAAENRTLAELVTEFLAHLDEAGRYQKRGKPTSQRAMVEVALRELCDGLRIPEKYEATVSRRVRKYRGFGGSLVRDFGVEGLQIHRDRLLEAGLVSPRGVNRKVGIIKRLVEWARDRGMFPKESARDIRDLRSLPVPARSRVQTVTREQVDAVIARLSLTLSAMVRIQLATGMRPGEVCALRWKDIEKQPENEEARKLGLWRYVVDEPKNAHHGDVDPTVYWLGPECQELLRKLRKPPVAFVFSPKDTVQQRWPGGAPGLMQEATDRYTTMAYRQAIERACAAAGVPRFTPHKLRHLALTEIANSTELGVMAANRAANHRSMETTLGYVHPDDGLAIKVARLRQLPSG